MDFFYSLYFQDISAIQRSLNNIRRKIKVLPFDEIVYFTLEQI
jgi:hypothetical protein